MSIILNNLESREGLTNIAIANISGPTGGEVYSFSPGWAYEWDPVNQVALTNQPALLNAFSIENNIVFLNEGWNLDFETKSVVNAQFSVDSGNINGFSYSYYNLNLPDDTTDVNIPLVRDDGLFYNEFLSFNIEDVDEGVTFTPVEKVNEGEYGLTLGTVTPNSPEIFDTVNFINSHNFYSIVDNKLKIRDEYYLNTEGWIDQDPSGGIRGWNVSEEGHRHQITGDLFLNVGNRGFSPGNDDLSTGLGSTDIISVSEQMALFENVNEQTNNIDAITDNSLPNIIVNPVNFRELYHEEVVGELSLINSTANKFGFFKPTDPENNDFTFTETDHAFLQIIEDNENYKLALKEDFFYNKDTGRVQEKTGSGYKLEDQTSIEGVNFNSIYITALDSNDDPITTREIHIKDILEDNHPDNYVINIDKGSPPWLTDIKFEKPNLPNTGREEYQKNVDYHWNLNNGEKIQYSFVDNNSLSYVNGIIEPVIPGLIVNDIQQYQLTDADDTLYHYEYLSTNDLPVNLTVQSYGQSYNETSAENNHELQMIKRIDPNADGSIGALKGIYESSSGPIGIYEGDSILVGQDVAVINLKIDYELIGDGLIAPSQDFKDAHRTAFDTWSEFINVEFEELVENSEHIVGDWRIGITEPNHFMPLQFDDPTTPDKDESNPHQIYAAYSRGVGENQQSGNIFYNGYLDNHDRQNANGDWESPDGIIDWNQKENMKEYSYNFSTIIHEVGHSLGLKHPFEEFQNDLNGNGDNLFQPNFDQMRYSVMSYTDNRDYSNPALIYDGTQLKLPDETKIDWQPKTPMLYDVMSLQEAYGPAIENSEEDTVYIFTPEKVPYECIYDTGGKDILDFSLLKGGSELNLEGDSLSIIGDDYLVPWKNTDNGTEYGTSQGGVLGLINASSRGGVNTEIEKIKLPSDFSSISTGEYSTCLIGKDDSQIEVTINSDQLGVKAFGEANDIIRLAQTTKNWGLNVKAKHTGNDGRGATNIEIQDMTKYLKHDLSLDLAGGMDILYGTEGNDAIFLNNLVTKGNTIWLEEMGENSDQIYSGNRLIGVNYIDLGDGDNLLDLSGQSNSLAEEAMVIKVGSGQDTLWLSDGHENVDTGAGNDNIIVNGGIDRITTGDDNDIITIADNIGNLTITDFDPNKDKLVFSTSEDKVSMVGELITVNNTFGDYVITLTGNVLSDLNSNAFSFI